jgi:hypothetical protein
MNKDWYGLRPWRTRRENKTLKQGVKTTRAKHDKLFNISYIEIPGANTEILGANNGCGCKDTGCKACVDDYKRRGVVT